MNNPMTNSQVISEVLEGMCIVVKVVVCAVAFLAVLYSAKEVRLIKGALTQHTAQLDRLTTQRSTHFKTDIGRIQQGE